jgi:hypothetical protein
MTPKRQAMIGHRNRQQFLIRIGLGLVGLKLLQRLVKLVLLSDAARLPLKQIGIPTTPCFYHVQNIANHNLTIWIIFHAKACFISPM